VEQTDNVHMLGTCNHPILLSTSLAGMLFLNAQVTFEVEIVPHQSTAAGMPWSGTAALPDANLAWGELLCPAAC
jgi:hypothetical protein